jgi:hypothetical protein
MENSLAPVADRSLLAEITTLERRLHDPSVRGDRSAAALLLADQFREFGSSGRSYDKSAILDLMCCEAAPDGLAATGFVATPLGPGAMLLTYSSCRAGQCALRSSIWIRREARWQMLFHQGTPIV